MLSSPRLYMRRTTFRIPQSARRTLSSGTSHTEPSKIIRLVLGSTAILASSTLLAFYFFDSRSAIHRYVFTPTLRHTLDPETSHKAAVKILRSGLGPRDKGVDDDRLRTELWGEALSNPIGLAAGFDKNGEAIDALFDLGFSWVEIGSVTPKPQPGNPGPRVFHLPNDNAIINRYGFPSDGAVSVLSRLRARLPRFLSSSQAKSETTVENTYLERASLRPHALLAINLGKNKSSPPDSPSDFLEGVKLFAPLADVLVINVSSPNTPGLRGMQTRGLLEELLNAITSECSTQAQGQRTRRPRIVLKIAPDLDDTAIEDIAEAINAVQGIDGVIVSNTTVQRPDWLSADPRRDEAGGLSGAPLKPITLRVLRTLRSHLPPSLPIIGCGGISTGADALEYARNGASAVQLYTAFGYDGPGACRRIKDELHEELERTGTTWRDVVQRAVSELSLKEGRGNVASDAAGLTREAAGTTLRELVHEALEIKDQLEALEERMSEKA